MGLRKLKFHEKKLLKKVNLFDWSLTNNLHEAKVLKRYRIQKRDDYTKYNKIARQIRDLANKLKELDPKDPFRVDSSANLLEKLHQMGLIPTKWSLESCDRVTASCFCRRRLPVVMVKSKMADSIRIAIQFVEQGHVRVGPEVVKDPAFLVTRNMEDFVTWVDTSAVKKHIMEYNEMRDDFTMA